MVMKRAGTLTPRARKYTGADYAMPIGPRGRVMWRVEADRQVTPKGATSRSH
jgi:hypothetical protein